MAILKSKSGYSYDTETGIRTNPDQTTTKVNSIKTSDMEGSDNFNLPETKTPDYSGLTAGINSTLATAKNDSAVQDFYDKQNADNAKIISLMKDTGQESALTSKYAEKEGVYEAKKAYDEYVSQIESEQKALRDQTAKIKENLTGALDIGVQAQISDAERKSLSKQADLAILQNAASRRYSTAMEIAKNKVEMELAPKKAELEAYKYIIDNNKAFQTAEFNSILRQKENEIENEQKTKEKIESIAIEAYKNGFKGNMDGVITVEDAVKKVGSFLISPMEKLQMEKLKGDIAKNTAELALAKQSINGTTGDPITDIIAGSSRYGDKRLTDSQLEKIQKSMSALGSMETLQGLLSQGKDGINVSGPLTGRLRTLVSQLGGDANASAINATIQGLIPTVARGIFGEVGVLTDADIANYRKTVPNLNATGQQNKLISLVMYDVLSRSLENTLVSNARNQTNVSGFVSDYQNVKSRISTLKSNLGVVDEVPINQVNKAKMESAWSATNINNTITSKLNSFFN